VFVDVYVLINQTSCIQLNFCFLKLIHLLGNQNDGGISLGFISGEALLIFKILDLLSLVPLGVIVFFEILQDIPLYTFFICNNQIQLLISLLKTLKFQSEQQFPVFDFEILTKQFTINRFQQIMKIFVLV
ncbi:hypothetical protein pb186bvf_020898, partial [Paramecium bursaria]